MKKKIFIITLLLLLTSCSEKESYLYKKYGQIIEVSNEYIVLDDKSFLTNQVIIHTNIKNTFESGDFLEYYFDKEIEYINSIPNIYVTKLEKIDNPIGVGIFKYTTTDYFYNLKETNTSGRGVIDEYYELYDYEGKHIAWDSLAEDDLLLVYYSGYMQYGGINKYNPYYVAKCE